MRYLYILLALALALMSGIMYYVTGDSFDRIDFSVWSAVCVLIGYMEFKK